MGEALHRRVGVGDGQGAEQREGHAERRLVVATGDELHEEDEGVRPIGEEREIGLGRPREREHLIGPLDVSPHVGVHELGGWVDAQVPVQANDQGGQRDHPQAQVADEAALEASEELHVQGPSERVGRGGKRMRRLRRERGGAS
jgi:hypothetical protein